MSGSQERRDLEGFVDVPMGEPQAAPTGEARIAMADGTQASLPNDRGTVMRFIYNRMKIQLEAHYGTDHLITNKQILGHLFIKMLEAGCAAGVGAYIDQTAPAVYRAAELSATSSTTAAPHVGARAQVPPPPRPSMSKTVAAPTAPISGPAVGFAVVQGFLAAAGISWCSELVFTFVQEHLGQFHQDPKITKQPMNVEKAILSMFSEQVWRGLVDKETGKEASTLYTVLWAAIANAPMGTAVYGLFKYGFSATAHQTESLTYQAGGIPQVSYQNPGLDSLPDEAAKFHMFMMVMTAFGAYRMLDAGVNAALNTETGKRFTDKAGVMLGHLGTTIADATTRFAHWSGLARRMGFRERGGATNAAADDESPRAPLLSSISSGGNGAQSYGTAAPMAHAAAHPPAAASGRSSEGAGSTASQ